MERHLDRISFQRELKQAESRVLKNVRPGIASSDIKFGTSQDRVASLNLVISYFDYRRDPNENTELSPMVDCFSSLTMTMRPHLAPSCYTVEGYGTWKDGPFQIAKGMFCSKTGEIFWVEKPAEESGLEEPRELLFTGVIRHFGIGGMWVLDRVRWRALRGGQGHAVSSYDPSHHLNLAFADFFWVKHTTDHGDDDDNTAECSEDSEEDEEIAAGMIDHEEEGETEGETWDQIVEAAQKDVLGDHVEACPLSKISSTPGDTEMESSMYVCFTSLLKSAPTNDVETVPFQFENAEVMKCVTRHWSCGDCPGQEEDFTFYLLGNNCTMGVLTPSGKVYWVQEWSVVTKDQILVTGKFLFCKGKWVFEGQWRSQSGGHGVVANAGDLGLLSSLLEVPLQDEEL